MPSPTINPVRILNQLRKERGLPRVGAKPRATKPKVTREMVRQICLEVWKEKYPRVFTDPNFELGVFTQEIVENEVRKRIQATRLGATVGESMRRRA